MTNPMAAIRNNSRRDTAPPYGRSCPPEARAARVAVAMSARLTRTSQLSATEPGHCQTPLVDDLSSPAPPADPGSSAAETWLTGVVNQAALLATEIAQLTDYLTAQRIADPANVINAHANALEEQLRQLETAADNRFIQELATR